MKQEEAPNIVKEFKSGNTRIRIADNFCRDTTEAQVAEILARIARTSQLHLMSTCG